MINKVAALILKDSHLLVVKKKKNKTHFILPGGKIETGELPKEALIRELLEEVSLSVQENELNYLLDFTVKSQFSDDRLNTTLYYLNSEVDYDGVCPDNEIDSLKWINVNHYNASELASGILCYGIPEAKKILGEKENESR
ncbi:NUDIX domain-containing protein [Melissococcus plutonius]|uniref:Nudix hydrolase domain-containing protein n=2 Tax=Melissococcus plutonius TaxID=33970 RepID=A0A2Z5Y193_9ENTE|nr:NUDIX domain-containing protein [Melissococcus plutonius]BAL61787.1 hypothetical protein MPD5_0518 [Melissococcus plutonius DAT561]MCV2498267.1 NUDIX domain-containing protein [Melissococcus plutonius]MCV2501852.1 NUDIX domain-containing protein [Melissococcus plutonius]MCV2504622.1 NUDIX domain-containing protein [Melissococcus plutonius]MCV2506882.1 NUDIX domain-containing protein [Melissococcus plutonius]